MSEEEMMQEGSPQREPEDQPVEVQPVEINPLDMLHQTVQTEKDRALRAMAELENFKRRKEQEVDQFKRYAKESAALDLLPILDSFDRACAHLDGFSQIQKQFHQVLEKWGVTPIEAEGKEFDPHLHQAVMETATETVAPGMITQEMQKGYKLHEKVIRPSMVAVAKAS